MSRPEGIPADIWEAAEVLIVDAANRGGVHTMNDELKLEYPFVYELYAKLGYDIEADRAETVRKVTGLDSLPVESRRDEDDLQRRKTMLWRNHMERIRPMLHEQQVIATKLANVAALKHLPTPMIYDPETTPPIQPSPHKP